VAQVIASLVANIGANITGFQKGASTVKGGMKDMAAEAEIAQKKTALLGSVVAATSALIVDSYKEYSQLSESIRDLSLVSGESAESTSRFIQVLDDYQLTAEDATAAAKKLKDNGLSPTIETLAMLSDQFRAIQDPAERMDFVYDKLGKSGAKYVNMLNQGSDALLANAAAINKNLIMSDLEIKMYEVGRLAIDEKVDALTAFRVELGQNVGNVLAFAAAMERAYEIQGESTKEFRGATVTTKDFGEALNQAIAEQLNAADASTQYKDSLKEQEEAAKAAVEANKELQKANESLIDGAIDITSRNKDFAASQQEILDNIAITREEGEKLYPWEAEKITENQEKLDELGQAYFDNLEDFKAAMQEKFTLYAIEQIAMSDGVAGFSAAEYEKARVILETTDVATAAAFEEQQAMAMLAQAVSDGTLPVQEWGGVLDSVMADGVASVSEVQSAIEAVPKENAITFTISTIGAPPNLDVSTDAAVAPKGTHRAGHATGGNFVIPSYYGTEGFSIGGGDTASGGEGIKITPRGKSGNEDVIAAIERNRISEERLAQLFEGAMLRMRQ
jgi:hypothetical protein